MPPYMESILNMEEWSPVRLKLSLCCVKESAFFQQIGVESAAPNLLSNLFVYLNHGAISRIIALDFPYNLQDASGYNQ